MGGKLSREEGSGKKGSEGSLRHKNRERHSSSKGYSSSSKSSEDKIQ